uniref:Uncharacterized protein n=1 Tax=Mycena chlorophos TaxID=658473 RepID=A0ABQ0LWJ0_MYCCL|nr:predicted protein [Mycena chlorophos]
MINEPTRPPPNTAWIGFSSRRRWPLLPVPSSQSRLRAAAAIPAAIRACFHWLRTQRPPLFIMSPVSPTTKQKTRTSLPVTHLRLKNVVNAPVLHAQVLHSSPARDWTTIRTTIQYSTYEAATSELRSSRLETSN